METVDGAVYIKDCELIWILAQLLFRFVPVD